ncbi:hypothetical protein SIN8267_01232 [Sinobacterium norvegicum]|uniref:DUF2269 family protein n=1 Tax=Sinobacterium norvegicum TaxID=1641715 RepID=A0ABN8EFD8_9GAMM|nr:hypothetical protein [Sinobacterium norvegicum]CAH0991130.1 hypothetical protein SIN8267_01232 [Sinobacterium norvegicum]
MDLTLIIHLIALGIWIGVVGAEFAIEFDGMKSDENLIKASKMHYTTDLWVEIPAFTTVLITGLLMLNESHLEGVFLYKVIFALLAIFFNIICVYAVFKRRKFALNSDLDGIKTTGTAMAIGGLIVPAFLIAFGLAIYIAW